MLIIVGFAIDIPLFSIIGSVLLIGLGGLVLSDDVQIITGENTTNTIDNGTIISTTTTNVYESYSWGSIGTTPYGVLFLLLGIGMFIISLTTMGDD